MLKTFTLNFHGPQTFSVFPMWISKILIDDPRFFVLKGKSNHLTHVVIILNTSTVVAEWNERREWEHNAPTFYHSHVENVYFNSSEEPPLSKYNQFVSSYISYQPDGARMYTETDFRIPSSRFSTRRRLRRGGEIMWCAHNRALANRWLLLGKRKWSELMYYACATETSGKKSDLPSDEGMAKTIIVPGTSNGPSWNRCRKCP